MSSTSSSFSYRSGGIPESEIPTSDARTRDYPYKGKARTHPTSTLVFVEHSAEARKIYYALRKLGWDADFPCSSPLLKLWVQWLQYFTRFWWMLPIGKCFTRSEIFYGNLIEGPSFAAFVKKCRFYTMQYHIALENMAIDEQYILDGWEGYDSIPPESNFIHWEEEIDDFPWCLIEPTYKVDIDYHSTGMTELLGKFFNKDLILAGVTNFLSFIKVSKVYDPSRPPGRSRTRLMRELLVDPGSIKPGWVGLRTKIQAMPAGGRDSSIATPSTLVKIKLAHEIFIQLCQSNAYSAMASHDTQERRVNRVRSAGKIFLHWDFKKLGLVCQREWFLSLAKAVQETYHIDMSWFDFDSLTVINGKRAIETKRGFALGWMNEGVTLVIIYWFLLFFRRIPSWEKYYDFIVFNDDVEIAIRKEIPISEMDVLKESLLAHFESLGVPCSIKKIFFSTQSIFLEEYHSPSGPYDFEKNSMAVRLYAKAAINSLPVARKAFLAEATQIYVDADIVKEIVSRTVVEFDPDEKSWAVDAGGFKHFVESGLNSITKHPAQLSLASELSAIVPTVQTTKFATDFSWKKALDAQNKIASQSTLYHDCELPLQEYRDSFVSGLPKAFISFAVDDIDEDNPLFYVVNRRARREHDDERKGVG